MVVVDFAPAWMLAGANVLVIVNARATSMTPLIASALLPCVVCTAFAAMVLVWPPVVAVAAIAMGNVIVQLPPAGMVPPVAVIDVPPTGAVTVAPHVPPGAGELPTVKPVPRVVRLSVNDVMVAAAPVVLVSVTVATVVAEMTGAGL